MDWIWKTKSNKTFKIFYYAGDIRRPLCRVVYNEYQSRKRIRADKGYFPDTFFQGGSETDYGIIWKLRLPRMMASIILGGALSLSGFCYRRFQ